MTIVIAALMAPAFSVVGVSAEDALPNRTLLTIASAQAPPGGKVVLPIALRDVAGTSLGANRAPGRLIQGIALRVTFAPAGAVESAALRRAGVTAAGKPVFEQAVANWTSASLLVVFPEATQPLALRPAPSDAGDVIAELVIGISPTAREGTVITLDLDPTVTMLSNQAGTLAESVGRGGLALCGGSLAVSTLAPRGGGTTFTCQRPQAGETASGPDHGSDFPLLVTGTPTPTATPHCVPPLRGDANANGEIKSDDTFFLINYLFSGGPAPVTCIGGDANNDGVINVSDVFYLINYLRALHLTGVS